MQTRIFIVCSILFLNGCAALTVADRDSTIKVAIHHPSFDMHKAAGSKFSVLPIRDLSGHYGVDYPERVMNAFINEVKRRSPELVLAGPEDTEKLMASVGKRAEYQVFANNCNDNIKYCPQKEELAALFRNSGVRYIVTLIVGSLDIPVPGVTMTYSISINIYDIDHGGEIVYQADCKGSAYSEYLEEGAAAFLTSVMEDAAISIVAKIYAGDEI